MDLDTAISKAAEKLEAETTSTPVPEVAAETSTATPETDTTPAPEDGASKPAASARARDDQGRFAPKPAEKAAEKAAVAPRGGANGAATAAPPAAEAKPGAVVPPATAPGEAVPEKPAESAHKPPQSWRADAREEWAKVPPRVQAEVLRREKEITAKLSEVAQTTRAAHEFQTAAQPWEALFRSQGISATQFLDIAARTQYTLTAGSPQQKAEVFAQLIRQSGVPIEVLDAALAGQPGAAPAAVDPATIAQQVEQRIQAQFRNQAAQIAQARAQETLTRFAGSHEFFDDVRGKMADILTARKQTNPTDEQMEDAYNLACMVTPEISAVVKQREAAKAAAASQEAQRRTAAAASSVRPSSPAAPTKAQPKGIDAALEMARKKLNM